MAEERAKWGSSLEFILTVIGYAVGLGNVWRFPYLVFKHGGAPFLIPFFIMMFLVGIPTFFLETAVGQFSGLSPSHAFASMAPLFQGLGYAAILINAFIGFYYNVVISYCIYYLLFSIRAELPWANCKPSDFDCFKRQNLSGSCEDELKPFKDQNITIRSPSEVYFYDQVLHITSGIESLGPLETPLVLSLLLAWFLVFVALVKGVASLGKISYFTATFPYIILTILVIRGALLEGANEGVIYYVGSFNGTKLAEPELWKDAATQVFYALSACSGGLISMSSFSDFNNNLFRDALLVPILDCLTGFYAGFAIFTVLGHMYVTKCVDSFAQVAAQGPELAFVVYPEGISLMGEIAPLFSVFFFVMMLALGFGSEFSIMESCMSTFIDVFKNFANTPKRVIMIRFAICLVYFLCGLTMVTQGGLYVLNLIDDVIAGWPLLVVAFLQVIVVPWVYGTKRFVEDIKCMLGKDKYPNWFWQIWVFCWRFLTPIVLLAIIIASIVLPSKPTSLRGKQYPDYALAIGWVIVATPLSAIVICAIIQYFKHKDNPRKLLQPLDSYYDNYKRHLRKLENEKEEPIQASNDLELNSAKPVEDKFETRNEIIGNTNNGYTSDDEAKYKIKKTYATFDTENRITPL